MAETVLRKLTTIFSADAEGYSRLMDVDEVATLATLKSYREAMGGLIARHHGRIVNTAGDAVLAEFASVVEAVQCAAEIQRELKSRNATQEDERQMHFRIGLNLGDVMIEGDDLYGEGVNIAARLQGLAEPGGICISGTVYDQVRNKLTLGYEFLGAQPVKNIAEKVPIYRVSLEPGAPSAEEYARARPASPARAAAGRVSDASPAARARRFYYFAAKAGFLLMILSLADLLINPDKWWVQWPALVIVSCVGLRGLQLLRGGDADPDSGV